LEQTTTKRGIRLGGRQPRQLCIEDILYNRIQGDLSSYSIAGRSLSKMSPDKLIELRDFYARQMLTEKRNERIRQKKDTGANILADFRK